MKRDKGYDRVVNTLNVYLHVPFCQKKCYYCDFNVVVGRQKRQPDYVAALQHEARGWARALRGHPAYGDPAVETIFFGGGTPTLLKAGEAAAILDTIRAELRVAPDAEITMEANPENVSRQLLRDLRAAGVNRLSFGVQTFDDNQLALLGRTHTAATACRAIADARAAGFDNLNLDLIYGLPGQQPEDWQATIERALTLDTEHISAYGLTIERATRFGKDEAAGRLTALDPDLAADLYETTGGLLTAAGFAHYEIANYARPGFACRHNLTYWRNEPFLGLGAGAHASIGTARFGNHRPLNRYLAAMQNWPGPSLDDDGVPQEGGPIGWVERLSPATQRAETAILALRLAEGLDLVAFQRRFGEDALVRWRTQLDELTTAGLLEIQDTALRLTARGRLLGDEVFTRFLLDC